MKIKSIILILFFYTVIVFGQTENLNYDSELASKLGADDYGMKTYIFVILKSGTVEIKDKDKRSAIFRGHLDNISRLVEEGKIVVAGPFMGNDKDYRGLFIFNESSIEEVKKLLITDPAVAAKILDTEIFQWYGSAALSEYLKTADKIWKIKP